MSNNNVFNPLGNFAFRDLGTGDLVFYPIVSPAASYEFIFTGSPDDLPNSTYWILALGGLAYFDGDTERPIIQLSAGSPIVIGENTGPLVLNGSTIQDANFLTIVDSGAAVMGGGAYTFDAANMYKVNGVQVLAAQQAAIADLAGAATLAQTIAKVNAILAMLRTHGLIAP